MRNGRTALGWTMLRAIVLATGLTAGLAGQRTVSFVRDVAPILIDRCSACHGTQRQESGWSLETFEKLTTPGESGAPPVVAGDSDASELVFLIEDTDSATRMPQEDTPLDDVQVEVIRAWIEEGAVFDGPDRNTPLREILAPRVHPAAPATYRASVPVLALAFAPDGEALAIGGYHEVLLRGPRDGALRRRIGGMPQRVHGLAFAPDGAGLAVAGGTPGEYGELRLVDLESGADRVPVVLPRLVLSVAYAPDGARVACGGADGSVRVVDARTGAVVWVTRLHADAVTAIAISADGRFVLSGSRDHSVKVFELGDGTLFTNYTRHTQTLPSKPMFQNDVFAVACTPDGGAVSAGEAGRVHLWDPVIYQHEDGTASQMEDRFQKADHVRILEEGKHDVFAVACASGAVWTAGSDGRVREHRGDDLPAGRVLGDGGDWLFALAAHQRAGLIAAAGFDGELRVWSLGDGGLVHRGPAFP